MTSETARALARREAECVSAYKVSQAISYKLDLITSGRITMESFKMSQSESILVTPLKPGDSRWLSGQEIFAQYAGTANAATFRCTIDCNRPMLISLMDQSATNMAAASYLQKDLIAQCSGTKSIDFFETLSFLRRLLMRNAW